MKTARRVFAVLLLAFPAVVAAEESRTTPPAAPAASPDFVSPIASYSEIPYYLNKLQEAQIDGERLRLNKVIHDAIVNADLSDKKVIKEMDPIIVKVQATITAGLDRSYLEGQSTWLGSAVNFYQHERLHPVVDVPETDWAQPQMAATNGMRISTYPDRILLHEGEKTRTATESSNIHEAVISPDGRKIAYFRNTDNDAKAEIWVVETRKLKRHKVTDAKSCLTLLFTSDGGRILFQEVPDAPNAEAPLYSVGTGGGKPREISHVRLLQTNVEKGKQKGNVVVFKALVHPMGTTIRDCAVLISPNGKEIGRLKDGPCR